MSLKENDKSLLSDPFLYQMGDDSHLYDATEKVLILRKTVQDKVYLYVFRYYILYVKTVFQWRPYRGGSHLPADVTSFFSVACLFFITHLFFLNIQKTADISL